LTNSYFSVSDKMQEPKPKIDKLNQNAAGFAEYNIKTHMVNKTTHYNILNYAKLCMNVFCFSVHLWVIIMSESVSQFVPQSVHESFPSLFYTLSSLFRHFFVTFFRPFSHFSVTFQTLWNCLMTEKNKKKLKLKVGPISNLHNFVSN